VDLVLLGDREAVDAIRQEKVDIILDMQVSVFVFVFVIVYSVIHVS
jgi:hypothetical protein